MHGETSNAILKGAGDFARLIALAERKPLKGGSGTRRARRPRVVVDGVVFFQCRDRSCLRWLKADAFCPIRNPASKCHRCPYCRRCDNRHRVEAKRRASQQRKLMAETAITPERIARYRARYPDYLIVFRESERVHVVCHPHDARAVAMEPGDADGAILMAAKAGIKILLAEPVGGDAEVGR